LEGHVFRSHLESESDSLQAARTVGTFCRKYYSCCLERHSH
jgi:hypothetical protein